MLSENSFFFFQQINRIIKGPFYKAVIMRLTMKKSRIACRNSLVSKVLHMWWESSKSSITACIPLCAVCIPLNSFSVFLNQNRNSWLFLFLGEHGRGSIQCPLQSRLWELVTRDRHKFGMPPSLCPSYVSPFCSSTNLYGELMTTIIFLSNTYIQTMSAPSKKSYIVYSFLNYIK